MMKYIHYIGPLSRIEKSLPIKYDMVLLSGPEPQQNFIGKKLPPKN